MAADLAEERTEKEHDFLDTAKEFDWDSVRSMLRDTPDLINVRPSGRWSALHQAAFEGNADVCKELVGLGADVDSLTRSGQTPLSVAKGKAKEALAEAGAPARGPPAEASEGGGEAALPAMKKARKESVARPYLMNINNAVDKDYEGCGFAEVASAPVSALKGISKKGAEILNKFGVKKVKDLGRWKFYRMAKGIAILSSTEAEGGRQEGSILNANKAMDKKHETKTLNEITELPPSALQGLASWADAELGHFHIKSIGALAEWKFARWAESIADMAEYETEDMAS